MHTINPQNIFNLRIARCQNLLMVKVILLVILIASSILSFAQAKYTIVGKPQLKVSGTSTIHDWEMVSNKATAKAELTIIAADIKSIESLTVTMPITSLKSGKGQMDNNAYKALNSDKYPNIQFEVTDVLSVDNHVAKVKGKLTISGSTQIISLDVKYKVSGSSIEFSGSWPIKFSAYNVEPPTAIFGTIKTGDDLEISFNVTFQSTI